MHTYEDKEDPGFVPLQVPPQYQECSPPATKQNIA